jgi:hypothetical protein
MDEYDGRVDSLLLDVGNQRLDYFLFAAGQDISFLDWRHTLGQLSLSGIGKGSSLGETIEE